MKSPQNKIKLLDTCDQLVEWRLCACASDMANAEKRREKSEKSAEVVAGASAEGCEGQIK